MGINRAESGVEGLIQPAQTITFTEVAPNLPDGPDIIDWADRHLWSLTAGANRLAQQKSAHADRHGRSVAVCPRGYVEPRAGVDQAISIPMRGSTRAPTHAISSCPTFLQAFLQHGVRPSGLPRRHFARHGHITRRSVVFINGMDIGAWAVRRRPRVRRHGAGHLDGLNKYRIRRRRPNTFDILDSDVHSIHLKIYGGSRRPARSLITESSKRADEVATPRRCPICGEGAMIWENITGRHRSAKSSRKLARP